MRFYAVDTLTGTILDRLYPSSWTLTDPLRTPGTGTLRLPKPEEDNRAQLVEFTRPRRRWIAVQDEATNRWVWGGPIPRKPDGTGAEILVPVVDWRTYFFHAYLRPGAGGEWRDYRATDVDQTTIAYHLFGFALAQGGSLGYWPGDDSTLTYPPIVRDLPTDSGVLRDRSLRMLDRPLGEELDGLVDVERGIEWWTYITPSLTDEQKLEVHATSAYPERTLRSLPLLIEYRHGKGGNATAATWPQGAGAATRAWAVGDGTPPDQVWAVDEDPEGGIVWEDKVGPVSGVKRAKTAFEHAYGHRTREAGAELVAEFTLTADTYPFGDLEPGDRARVVYDDGWESVDVDNARVTGRTMSGGVGQADQQKLTLDLSDVTEPDDGTEPGIPGTDEGA